MSMSKRADMVALFAWFQGLTAEQKAPIVGLGGITSPQGLEKAKVLYAESRGDSSEGSDGRKDKVARPYQVLILWADGTYSDRGRYLGSVGREPEDFSKKSAKARAEAAAEMAIMERSASEQVEGIVLSVLAEDVGDFLSTEVQGASEETAPEGQTATA